MKARYLIIDVPFSYNMIIGWLTFIQLGATLFALYFFMKYPLLDEKVEVILGDQKITTKCWVESLELKKTRNVGDNTVGVKLGAKP